MKYLLLITFILSNFAFAERIMPVQYIKNADGQCEAIMTKKSTRQGYLTYPNSLESQYCARMFPKSYKDAFSINKDIPANKLDFDMSIIDEYIENKESISASFNEAGFLNNRGKKLSTITVDREEFDKLSTQVDWESFYDLNQSAQDLWSRLVLGYGAEQARYNYYKKRKFSKQHKKEIMLLKKEVLSFLESTEIGNTWGLNLLGRVHPFITQIVLENLVLRFPYYLIDEGIEYYMAPWFGKTTRYLMKKETIDWKSSFAANTKGLSTISAVEHNFVYKLKDDDIKHLDGLAPGILRGVQLYLNSIYILQMVSENQCSDWGLWPGTSRVVLNYLTLMRQSEVYHPHELVLNNAMEKINNACGHAAFGQIGSHNYTPASVSPIYRVNTKHSKKLAKEFRKLAKRWE